MSIADLYADGIDENIRQGLRQPAPAAEPSFGLWSALGAGFKGVPGGGLEATGSAADVLSMFGTALAATDSRSGGMFASTTPEERKQEQDARKKMLAGQALDPTAGNTLRRRAAEFAPDPATAHQADQVLYGLGRFGAKAVAAVGTMGPAGAVPLGLEEANTAYRGALLDGIDSDTALKLGAVQGGIAAAGAVLPLGAATKLGTAGLVAAGGPGAFMAQEQLSKKILESAGFQRQADLHDPFDPLGLSISTILPGAFGGLHMRGVARRAAAVEGGGVSLAQMTPAERQGLKYSDPRLDDYAAQAAEANGVPPEILLAIKNAGEKSNSNQTSPKGAQGVMQFMPATAKEIGIVDPRDPIQSIDGAARYMRKLYDAYGSWDAAVAHYNGGGSQAAIVRGGGKPTFPETAAYLERVQKYAAERAAENGARSPEVVDAARVKVAEQAIARSLPEHPEAQAEVMRAADYVAEGRIPEVMPPPAYARPTETPEFKSWFGDSKVADDQGTPLVVYHGTNRDFDGFSSAASRNVNAADAEGFYFSAFADDASAYATSTRGGRSPEGANVVPAYVSLKNPYFVPEGSFEHALITPARRRELEAAGHDGVMTTDKAEVVAFRPEQIKSAIGNSGRFDPNSASLTDRTNAVTARDETANPLPARESAPTLEEPAVKMASSESAAPSLDTQRVKTIADADPSLRVKLPGSDETLTVAEALKRAEEEAKYEKTEADLVKAALDCALSYGG